MLLLEFNYLKIWYFGLLIFYYLIICVGWFIFLIIFDESYLKDIKICIYICYRFD